MIVDFYNIRGNIIPAIDLRLKHNLSLHDNDNKTYIIIVEIMNDGN